MKRPVWKATIDGLANGGDGVGRAPDGRALFVAHTAPGDEVEIELVADHKTFTRGRLIRVLKPGPARIQPPCPVAGVCGGCAWQHLSMPAQTEAKTGFLREALRRIGGVDDPPLLGVKAPTDDGYRYRNKAQVPVALAPDGSLRLGYYREGSHGVVALPDEGCRLLAPAVDAALKFVRDKLPALGLQPYDERKDAGELRHVMVRASTRGEAMVVLVTRHALDAAAAAKASAWAGLAGIVSVQSNLQPRSGNAILGEQSFTLAGPSAIDEDLDGLRFRLSATSFFQVNPAQAMVMVRALLALRPWAVGEPVLELYSGVGTLSLPLARLGVRLHGVELNAAAVADAQANAAANGLSQASFSVGGAGQGWHGLPTGFRPRVLVVDPPRKGLEPSVLEALQREPVDEIAYLSCDPASLARDIKGLRAQGYELLSVQGVDLFPQTPHVESVSLLRRRV